MSRQPRALRAAVADLERALAGRPPASVAEADKQQQTPSAEQSRQDDARPAAEDEDAPDHAGGDRGPAARD
ncbi:hypothetical protein A8924_3748 [Saccharopolyspora erythraea NRRL 2338]|uniref:Uncharacterized protein n=2 Tax=Saccharopolyspora erythraea TaxID=1836 RepID=A0ABN1CAB1_SACER|nr:hypothetical protein [Saccharopolyspora erythraea]PFG96355.1 hypothetical protein A8924_3748 [Saccharopolyspora erythraea NRRL 2338]QRK92865.1 hypothetical protein JQX30_17170 [Saccharopolyspora erythraea]